MKTILLVNGTEVLVDTEDFDELSKFRWFLTGKRYAGRKSDIKNGPKEILMHRGLLFAPKGLCVDHINGNGLDNRKSNLRICTQSDNSKNQRKRKSKHSRFKGVTWDIERNKWQAKLCFNYKTVHLGRFLTEIEAANAYDIKATELFGGFALLNKAGSNV